MLRHIAIHINEENEIQDFYSDVLHFTEFNRFDLDKNVAEKVFGLSSAVEVVRMRQFNVELELLIHPAKLANGLAHHALEFWRMQEVYDIATQKGYQHFHLSKENGRNAFYVKDKAGNLFELKEINNI